MVHLVKGPVPNKLNSPVPFWGLETVQMMTSLINSVDCDPSAELFHTPTTIGCSDSAPGFITLTSSESQL